MSFICENCGKPQRPHTKPIHIVTEVREVTYDTPRKVKVGFETAEQIDVCPRCAKKLADVPAVLVGYKTVVDKSTVIQPKKYVKRDQEED
jgi:hypothetical protein